MDHKENFFFDGINTLFESWQKDNYRLPNKIEDDFELTKISSDVFKDFLGIDESLAEKLFKKIHNTELIDFIFDYYSAKKFIYFVMYTIHLIIEEEVTIFLSNLKLTGKHYGHWATGELDDTPVLNLINQRIIDFQNHNFQYSTYYKKQYKAKVSKTDPLSKIKTEAVPKVNDRQIPEILIKLVGASGAALLFGSIIYFGKKATKFWIDETSKAQVMLPIGAIPGSIDLYGFCFEKFKQAPTPKSVYFQIHQNQLDEKFQISIKRLSFFRKYLLLFLEIDDKRILSIAKKQSDLIWFHFQLILWLITQKFVSDESNKHSEEIFFVRNIKPKTDEYLGESVIVEDERILDIDMLYLTQHSIDILDNIKHSINPHNELFFRDLKKSVESHIEEINIF